MNINFLDKLFMDLAVFSFLQVVLLVLLIFAFLTDRGFYKRKGAVCIEVKRGEKSWSYFHLVYGFLSILFLEIINTTEAFKGYKTAITIFDLSVLVYLCFFSSWFRNKIVGVIVNSKSMTEK